MMAQLENTQRAKGGMNRANNQSKKDRSFQAMLAASRRPLLHDAQATPEGLIRELRELADLRRWLYLGLVGSDLRTIRHGLSDEIVTKRLAEVGGAIGFVGITVFGDPEGQPTIQSFYKPLKKGTGVIEKLDKAARNLKALIIPHLMAPQDKD
jgi:hypothetical protein